MSQACPFTTRPTHTIILLNVLNEHPIQALQPARKPNNHFLFSFLIFTEASDEVCTSDRAKGMVHKNRDGAVMGSIYIARKGELGKVPNTLLPGNL